VQLLVQGRERLPEISKIKNIAGRQGSLFFR